MKRTLSLLLIPVLILPGCAARSAAGVQTAPAAAQTGPGPAPQSAERWKEYLDRIPAGSRVKVTLTSGRELSAVLMTVEADRLVVSRRTRIPEAPVTIPFDTLALVELDTGGMSAGQAVGIALGAAGAAIGALFLLALALGGD